MQLPGILELKIGDLTNIRFADPWVTLIESLAELTKEFPALLAVLWLLSLLLPENRTGCSIGA